MLISTSLQLFKRRKWSRKQLKRISLNRSEVLRRGYLDDIRQFVAEDLVFLDESIFNEKTGWRYHGYAPTGTVPEINADINRGKTWSICAAMTLDGYLPCTVLKEGYFNTGDFLVWLQEKLLPEVNRLWFPMVIVMDNLSIHAKEEVRQIIEEAGHVVRYLPPYSPDYNPIEVTFSVLKAWMKHNWIFLRQSCNTFGNFLELALRESRCDRFARQQFRHAGNGVYIEEEELIRFRRHLEQYEVDHSIEL